MGVINITPNSFSDTLKSSHSPDAASFFKKMNHFKSIPGLIYDLGFESTAPMNEGISGPLERQRFVDLMTSLSPQEFKDHFQDNWISFDTYRVENYRYFEDTFNSRLFGCGFLFNDVSGVIDSPLLEFLHTKKDEPHFFYIFNNTHIPLRSAVSKHMSFQKNDKGAVLMALDHFHKGMEEFKKNGVDHKILLDPGFGFSKNLDQNWELVEHFDDLLSGLSRLGINGPLLIGLSKKSFLRSRFPDSLDPYQESEILHAQIIKEMSLLAKGRGIQLIFRAHDPYLVESVYDGLSILE